MIFNKALRLFLGERKPDGLSLLILLGFLAGVMLYAVVSYLWFSVTNRQAAGTFFTGIDNRIIDNSLTRKPNRKKVI